MIAASDFDLNVQYAPVRRGIGLHRRRRSPAATSTFSLLDIITFISRNEVPSKNCGCIPQLYQLSALSPANRAAEPRDASLSETSFSITYPKAALKVERNWVINGCSMPFA
jgi:hypothetical protein